MCNFKIAHVDILLALFSTPYFACWHTCVLMWETFVLWSLSGALFWCQCTCIGSSLLVPLSELQVLKQRTYPLCRSSGDSMGDVGETPFCRILVLSICVTMCSRSARWVNVHSVTLCSWMTAWAADNRGIVRNQGAPWTSHCFGLLLWKLSDFCCYHEQ